jgi:hypothetical protein
MVRNATEADFRFVPRKVLFPFLERQNQFFVKQLPKREIESWEKHPTLIVDHLGYAHEASFCCGSLRRYILNFVQAPAGTAMVLHFSAKKTTS